ncbi:family 78 glycoside hydrolase catalytic domain [Blautia segnis]|uniref:alpha-L-rhamnosidase n=1 Tax=Blautia segnis TaxID=2763030 RepID=A0A8I0DRW3_9FIRM|nr:family 78 glycoside hydrolase catalytic domain [Blautia segnis]MBC5651248.1 family 78 glycoside hydrolase catalytic domain [Blautia segnis]CCY32621.1 alpha-L-rhamnosidase N-terminal domain./Bacterial alpha-L-rhamnosidase [Ruminococcus sp. CAG:60]
MNRLGNWISGKSQTPFYARREFNIKKQVQKATAYVCGLGQFIFHINGQKVSDHELDPGWTNYDKKIQYVKFDVTKLLHEGKNALGVEVGNGWFLKEDEHYTFTFPAFMPPNPNPYRPFGKELVLAIKLVLDYADETEEILYADENFQVKEHPVKMSNVYGSETYDASLEQTGWDKTDFDASEWKAASVISEEDTPKGELVEQFQPAIKVIRSYPAKYIHSVCNRDIYDLGQNVSGMLKLSYRGKKGDVLRIYPAEKLDKDKNADQVAKSWGTVGNCITCVVGEDDVWQEYRMRFTYFAGRYFAVEKSSEAVEVNDITGEAISSAWKTNGTFQCDDSRYVQIYDLVEKAVEANMVSVHTDCPTLERFAWQEPNHLMAPSIMYMKDGRKLWEKFFMDMRTDQLTENDYFMDLEGNRFYPGAGLIPSQAPCYVHNVLPVPGMGSFFDIIPWGSSGILGVKWHYLFYGDKQVIADNYEMGKKYLEHLKTKQNAEGFLNYGLGDWGNPDNQLARENVETAFLYADAITLAEFAEILGEKEDEVQLRQFAEEIKENYNQRLLVQDEKGKWCYRSFEHTEKLVITQACEALPLYWGMVPEDKVSDVAEAFRQTFLEKRAFASGEVGLPYIIQTASRYGMNDLICSFIMKPEHPSYYAFVKEGLTTLGEYWEENPRSHCHDMMGHIIEWYYNGLAGIKPLEPGFKKVLIKPYLPESMNYMKCRYESVSGMIQVILTRKDGRVEVETDIAEGISFEIDCSNLK